MNYKLPINNNFFVENNFPLDAKTVVTSLTNISVEIPKIHRYLGLIFYNKEDKKYYSFRTSLDIPELLVNIDTYTATFGIVVNDYNTIISELNNFAALGKSILVTPLNVIFNFNGTEWKYETGIYSFSDINEYNLLPTTLKEKNKLCYIGNELHIINEALNPVKYINKTNTVNNLNLFNNDNKTAENYHEHRLNLYKNFDNKQWVIGRQNKVIENFNIVIGKNLLMEIPIQDIGDNNLPPYITAILWINNNIMLNNFVTAKKPLLLDIFYIKNDTNTNWELYCESDVSLTGTLELKI